MTGTSVNDGRAGIGTFHGHGGLDDIDRAVVERLRKDGRETNRALSQALAINEVTVATRIRRLELSSIMRVVAVTDMR
ncbi:AsnC family protein [Nocardia sp. NPDC055029]